MISRVNNLHLNISISNLYSERHFSVANFYVHVNKLLIDKITRNILLDIIRKDGFNLIKVKCVNEK